MKNDLINIQKWDKALIKLAEAFIKAGEQCKKGALAFAEFNKISIKESNYVSSHKPFKKGDIFYYNGKKHIIKG